MGSSTQFLKISSVLVAASTAALILYACGENTSEPEPVVATTDAEVQVTAATIPILYAEPLEFVTGVPELGTTTATTLSFSANDTSTATPVFNVKTTTDSASGVTTFGSCIFTVNKTSFPPPVLQLGATITITPCEVNVATGGKEVGETIEGVQATFTLGNTSASPKSFTVEINDDGEVIVTPPNGEPVVVGEVIVAPTTGANQ